jgi:hypothetical protein
MNHLVPAYLPPFVLLGTVGTIATLLFGLYRALRRTAWPAPGRLRAFWSLAAILVAWSIAALVPVRLGFYQGTPTRIPTIPFGLLIPIAAGVMLFWRWPLLRRVIGAVPQEWIVSVQVYRALGFIFLVLYASGRLPREFAWPAGAGDVLVGLLAPFAGLAYARGSSGSANFVRAWNLFGLADLVVALTTGFLSSPSQFQMLAFDRPNELIGAFPLAMVPVFLVPLSVLLHLASLEKLRPVQTGPHAYPISAARSVPANAAD